METIVIYILVYTIEALILWWYASNLFHSKYSKLIEFISIFSGYCFLFLISFWESFGINSVIFSLFNFFIFLALYNAKWSVSLFHSLILTSIMSFSELAIIIIFAQFDKISLHFYPSITVLIIEALLSKAMYYISLRVVVILTHGKKIENEYVNRSTALLNIIPFVSFYIIITLSAILLTIQIPTPFRYMLSSCAALLLFINILILYIYHYTQQKNKEFTEMQLQLQKEYDMTKYYKTLFSQNESQQILIHDIRKHLMTISRLNEQNQQTKIGRYLNTLLNSSDLQNTAHFSDNELLNSILCHYMQICQKEHIEFDIDIRKKLLSNLDYSDLTALFCNLLDNALEACSNISDAYIELSITNNNGITVISVINTCRLSPAFNKDGMPISSKSNKSKHGFGLKSIERVINKYNGSMSMYYNDERKTFHTIITINENF